MASLGTLFEPEVQLFDNSGQVLAGGKVYFYAGGTLVPQNTYADAGLTTPNANPVILDSAGRAVIFLQPAAYKVIVTTSADVTLWTVDNLLPAGYVAAQTVLPFVTTKSNVGTQNDLAILASSSWLRLTNGSDLTITGLSGSQINGQVLRISSIGAGNVFLAHESSGSLAANRLHNAATSADTPLAAGTGDAVYVYDSLQQRWWLVAHDQGAWLTPTFTAGNFTGNASMTWTVASGDRTTLAYRLALKTLTVAVILSTTTVGGTPNTTLQISNAQWGGFTAIGQTDAALAYLDNLAPGTGVLRASATSLQLFKDLTGATNWTASPDLTFASAVLTFPVS